MKNGGWDCQSRIFTEDLGTVFVEKDSEEKDLKNSASPSRKKIFCNRNTSRFFWEVDGSIPHMPIYSTFTMHF